jgi:hypothetical protein
MVLLKWKNIGRETCPRAEPIPMMTQLLLGFISGEKGHLYKCL